MNTQQVLSDWSTRKLVRDIYQLCKEKQHDIVDAITDVELVAEMLKSDLEGKQ